MTAPANAPIDRLAADAARYLATQFGDQRAPALTLADVFDEQPLDKEGLTAIFRFELPASNAVVKAAGGAQLPHYVAVGVTEPNYYPAYNLAPDDAYSLHIGTRFMLVMGVASVDLANEPDDAREQMRAFVAAAAPGARLGADELVALFACEDQRFAAYRVRVDDEPLYVFGADCPPGFYQTTYLPPAVVLRLHLGKLIRAEARQAPNVGP